MEMKHIKLLLAPFTNASQTDINYFVSFLFSHWKIREEEENACHACVTDSKVFIYNSTAG